MQFKALILNVGKHSRFNFEIFSHYSEGIWNIFPTHILTFGDLEEFSLEYMEMFKVASTWPCRELQPLWRGFIINNKIIWAGRDLKDHLILTPMDLLIMKLALGLSQLCSSSAAVWIRANSLKTSLIVSVLDAIPFLTAERYILSLFAGKFLRCLRQKTFVGRF